MKTLHGTRGSFMSSLFHLQLGKSFYSHLWFSTFPEMEVLKGHSIKNVVPFAGLWSLSLHMSSKVARNCSECCARLCFVLVRRYYKNKSFLKDLLIIIILDNCSLSLFGALSVVFFSQECFLQSYCNQIHPWMQHILTHWSSQRQKNFVSKSPSLILSVARFLVLMNIRLMRKKHKRHAMRAKAMTSQRCLSSDNCWVTIVLVVPVSSLFPSSRPLIAMLGHVSSVHDIPDIDRHEMANGITPEARE